MDLFRKTSISLTPVTTTPTVSTISNSNNSKVTASTSHGLADHVY